MNRLENSRSRKQVSVDGFKMINGHIVRAEDAESFGSDQCVQQHTIPSVDQPTVARLWGKVASGAAYLRQRKRARWPMSSA
ncbi:MAG TPA: hypothetical protein VI074_06305 [Propionibacteriaceae bacterium]